MFAELFDLDLQEFVTNKSQDDLFAELSNLDLQDFPTRNSQDATEIENLRPFDFMGSSPQLQLLTTRQRNASQVWEYVSNYVPSLLTPGFHDKDINAKITAKFGLDHYSW